MSNWKKKNQGKKKKNLQSNISNQLISQKKDNLIDDIEQQNDQNQNLMGSLLMMQQELRSKRTENLNDQASNVSFSKQNAFMKKSKPQMDGEVEIYNEENGEQELNPFKTQKNSIIIQPIPDVFFIQKKKRAIKEEGLKEGEKKVLSKEELWLLIVILKKLLNKEIEKNKEFKKEQSEREIRVTELGKKVKVLKDKEIKLKLLPKLESRKVETIKFDLKQLDEKIDKVDNALNDVLEGNDLQYFIKETEERNVKLNTDVQQNLQFSKNLSNKMELIYKALIRLNSQQQIFQLNLKFAFQLDFQKFFWNYKYMKRDNVARSSKGQRGDSYFLGEGSNGIKMNPKSVLVLSLIFIGSVVVLHILDKIKFS